MSVNDDSIEERLKKLLPNKCRICLHFIRVNQDGEIKNPWHRQGFCILGQLCGNYELYLSTSTAASCMGFILSRVNADLALAEDSLRERCEAFCESVQDKRTLNYKKCEPLMKAHEEFFNKAEKAPMGLAWLHAQRKVHQIAREQFERDNEEEYLKLHRPVTLRKAHYSRFLAKLTIQLHDEFCKCDRVIYVDGSSGEEAENK